MTREEAEHKVGEYLHGARLTHSLSVAWLSEQFGMVLGEDAEALYLAGLFHDIAKQKTSAEQLAFTTLWCAEQGSIAIPDNPEIYHPLASAWITCYELGVTDTRIIQAVARHATGGSGMTRFEECVYAADYLDPARPFPEQAAVWTLMARDFDEALLAICRQTMQSVMNKRQILDPSSLDYHNELIMRFRHPDRHIVAMQGPF